MTKNTDRDEFNAYVHRYKVYFNNTNICISWKQRFKLIKYKFYIDLNVWKVESCQAREKHDNEKLLEIFDRNPTVTTVTIN